ncbi:MAG TPA: undecaprenyl-diphosphate phosphatase, partial [Candidatus Acidoferrales bacterium]|nr:undecaprenyl-diphosphate phosphatase [Candidatus Acidoferrales bacterium]
HSYERCGMDLLQSLTLGFIQGTTEWLPISSTGHLRVAEHFFGLTVPLLFDVLLHFGTLLVTLIFFRKEIINVLGALWHRDFRSADGKLIVPIIVGSVPTALIAASIGNELDAYFSSLPLLAAGFIASGIILLASKWSKERNDQISVPVALLIGVMQGLAIIPAVSRSGLTIAAMLLLGIKRDLAFKYSFLLSIPAVVGALGLTLYEGRNALALAGIGTTEILASLAVAVAVSFLALKLLQKTLSANKFWLFSIYCFAIGAALAALAWLGF